MAVITISREFYSLGGTTAQEVAKALGYHLVTKRTIERILRQFGYAQLDELHDAPNLWARADASNLELVSLLNKIVLGFAKLDNMVIVGRGGFAILRDYANVLNVRIQAPFAVRVQRLMDAEGLPASEAQELVAQNDKARNMFIKGFYDLDFRTAPYFQLVLDTGIIPAETVSKWIVEATRFMEQLSFGDAPTTPQIDIADVVVTRSIQDALEMG